MLKRQTKFGVMMDGIYICLHYRNGRLTIDYSNCGHVSRGDLVRLSKLEEEGAVDFGVPQDWFDLTENKVRRENGGWAVWFYPRERNALVSVGPVWNDVIEDRIVVRALRMLAETYYFADRMAARYHEYNKLDEVC